MKRAGVGLACLVVLLIGTLFVFQKPIGTALFKRAVAQNIARNSLAGLDDGLHLGLCGTGSPMPNLQRAGPCNIVVAGNQRFVVDIGEGGNEVLNLMGVNATAIDALLLTHFHSDHIDGLGPLMLYHWTRGARKAPLPVIGPRGVEGVVAGFNNAYRADDGYRTAHHGPSVAPPGGGGGRAIAFDMPRASVVILNRRGLKITAFKVNHHPVAPAVGYRFDYKGRSLCISGDTLRSPTLEAVCKGADIIVHDALQPALVNELQSAMAKNGQANAAAIFRDIQDYHATPEQAADSARAAGARMLVLSHLVPPLPASYLYPAFLGDAPSRFDGPIVVGEDGMFFSMLPNSEAIVRKRLMDLPPA